MMDDVQGAAAPTAAGLCQLGREITASRPNKPRCDLLEAGSTNVRLLGQRMAELMWTGLPCSRL